MKRKRIVLIIVGWLLILAVGMFLPSIGSHVSARTPTPTRRATATRTPQHAALAAAKPIYTPVTITVVPPST